MTQQDHPVPPGASPAGAPTQVAAPVGTEVAPVIPGAPIVKQTERPHPLTPFLRSWFVMVAIAVALGRDLLPGGRNGDDDRSFTPSDLTWAVPGLVAVLLVAGLIGFVSWYFTRFVIDDEELRIETGAVFKNSKRVSFERLQSIDIIQPFAARIFGLAELRLEVGSGDSTIKLRYLSRTNASQLRDYLVARAHGEHASRASSSLGPAASLLTDLGATDHPLVTVTPQRLIGSFLMSSEWLVTMVLTVVALVVTARYQVMSYALPGLIPLAIGGFSMVSRRVVSMFHFTLAQSARGLRVTRGLTNLTSQSVPVDRIQGLKISQPLLWRPFGWFRVDVDILGYGASAGENNQSDATSVLLPVATADQVTTAMDEVLPGVNLSAIGLRTSPRRARWFNWFTAHTLRYGWDESVLITEHGLLSRVRNVVPHAKTQSVRIEQGPMQRRLRLANVHVDTPKGPVNAVARELDEVDARALALGQLDRARTARALHRDRLAARRLLPVQPPGATQPRETTEPRAMAEPNGTAAEAAVLARFGIDERAFLGAGSESRVFALDAEHVLRVYRSEHEGPVEVAAQLRALYDSWARSDPGLEMPRIVDAGELVGRVYTVDRRMSGRGFSGWLAEATAEERRAALPSYLRAATSISRLPSPVAGFARLVGDGAPQQFGSLAELLSAQLQRVVGASRDRLVADLPEVAAIWAQWHTDVAGRVTRPYVVHGDFCPPNAFCSRGPDGAPVVSGVVDFSPHTLVADPWLDVTGAICFLELESYAGAAEDAAWLTEYAVAQLGADLRPWIGVYRRFYGFYFSSAHRFDERLYAWCLAQLRPNP